MKIIPTEGIRPCPVCGGEAVMRKNASKRFQVKCKNCSCQSIWTDKTSAVVKWYNNAEFYERTHGKKGDM